MRWMCDMIATGNVVSDNLAISDRIVINKIPSGNEYFTTILNAMKENKNVEITYHQFGSPYDSTFPIEPYCVRLFENRWYLLGKNNYEDIRIYSLDRVQDIYILNDKFALPKDFDAEQFFEQYFGTIIDQNAKPKRIVIRAYKQQKYYIETLPLHDSQTKIADTEDYADFSLYVVPTFDLQLKLLSYGSMVEVLKPEELRKEMKGWIAEMADVYKMKCEK